MLLLSIKRIPFPLHKFSSFSLSLLISSSRSWSSRWMTLDKTISISLFTSFSLIAFITFLIFCIVLTLYVRSLVLEWIPIIFGFFQAVGWHSFVSFVFCGFIIFISFFDEVSNFRNRIKEPIRNKNLHSKIVIGTVYLSIFLNGNITLRSLLPV